MAQDDKPFGLASTEQLGDGSAAWVCPWDICNHAQAQACRQNIGRTKTTRGCGNRFPPGTTAEQAKTLVQRPTLDELRARFDGWGGPEVSGKVRGA